MTTLWIEDSNASPAEIEAGIAAALALISKSGRSVDEVVAAHKARLNDIDHSAAAAELWDKAEFAAFKVAFKRRGRWPEDAALVAQCER